MVGVLCNVHVILVHLCRNDPPIQRTTKVSAAMAASVCVPAAAAAVQACSRFFLGHEAAVQSVGNEGPAKPGTGRGGGLEGRICSWSECRLQRGVPQLPLDCIARLGVVWLRANPPCDRATALCSAVGCWG